MTSEDESVRDFVSIQRCRPLNVVFEMEKDEKCLASFVGMAVFNGARWKARKGVQNRHVDSNRASQLCGRLEYQHIRDESV